MVEIFTDYTLRTVALGAIAIGVVSGALGTYAVLRRQALVGDAISHAALPGIALAYLVGGSKDSAALTTGAALAGFGGTLAVIAIVRTTRIKSDAALGLVLSVFFGFGLVLLTWIQGRPDAGQAGLDTYLFGQAATLVEQDVVLTAAVGAVALATAMLLWKELKLLSFDPDFAAAIGLRVRALEVLLTALLVVAIAIGLQTVGVVLMSAMLVAPAAAARQWTNRLGAMMAISATFGALAGATGAVLSAKAARLPAGPTIVLCVTGIVVTSLLLAPRRGMLWRRLGARRRAAELRVGTVLTGLEGLAREHGGAARAHPAAVVSLLAGADATVQLEELERRGWAARFDEGWAVTEEGRREARRREDRT